MIHGAQVPIGFHACDTGWKINKSWISGSLHMLNNSILVSFDNIHDWRFFRKKSASAQIRHSLRKQRVSCIVGFIVVIHRSYISILWKICISRVISILFEDTSLPFWGQEFLVWPYDWMIMSLMDHDNLCDRSLSSLAWIFEFCGNVLSRHSHFQFFERSSGIF